MTSLPRQLRLGLSIMKRHPVIPLISIITFGALCTLGLMFIRYIDKWYKAERDLQAFQVSNDIGRMIIDTFDQALVPMYTLSKFIVMEKLFHDLPHLIDMAPFKNGSDSIRNVTGLCSADENKYSSAFNVIAQAILDNSNLTLTKVGTSVLDIRVAPYGVQCLIFPSQGAIKQIGNDWRFSSSTEQRTILKNTVLDNRLYIIGPFPMGSSPEVFCTHIPINIPNQNYTFNYANTTRPSYGFVQMFFNWTKLKENIQLHDLFDQHGLGYNIYMNISGTRVTIANSTSFSSLRPIDVVSSRIETSYNSWTIEAGFLEKSKAYDNVIFLDIIVVCASFVMMVLIMLHLITRQKHKELLYKMMPSSAIKKINRGDTVVENFQLVTIFFCDIVGFTTMAGEMTPLTVMEMLNDLYVEFDKLTIKHNVYKVETIGDCFMAIAGAPYRCTGPVASQKIALFALDVLGKFIMVNFKCID